MTLFDAHLHLQDPRLREHQEEIFRAWAESGVRKVVVNGTREEDWADVLKLADESERVIASVGLHPWHARERSAGWKDAFLRALHGGKRGVGEIGLDRWMKNFDAREQEDVFRFQLEAAAERNVPVTIHCLKAWGRMLEILRAAKRPARGFLLHSYGGPPEMAPAFSALGGHFSLSGYFAHPAKERQREVFRSIPIERLLLETDAPDMLPPEALRLARIRGPSGEELNHPANIVAVYSFAARLLGLSEEELAARVAENFTRLFGGLFTP